MNPDPELYDRVEAVAKRGCNDPLFRYWKDRYVTPPSNLTFVGGRDYISTFLVLGRSQYSPLERCWSALRAFEQSWGSPREEFFRKQLDRQFLEVLNDAAIPETQLLMIAKQYLKDIDADKLGRPAIYAKMEELLRRNWPESACTYSILRTWKPGWLGWPAVGTMLMKFPQRPGRFFIATSSARRKW